MYAAALFLCELSFPIKVYCYFLQVHPMSYVQHRSQLISYKVIESVPRVTEIMATNPSNWLFQRAAQKPYSLFLYYNTFQVSISINCSPFTLPSFNSSGSSPLTYLLQQETETHGSTCCCIFRTVILMEQKIPGKGILF